VQVRIAEQKEAIRTAVYEGLLVQAGGAPVTRAGSLSVSVEVEAKPTTDNGAGPTIFRTRVKYRFKKVSLVWQNGELVCPELSVFLPALRDQWAANVDNRRAPSVFVLAERLFRWYRTVLYEEGNTLYCPLDQRECAATWRHFVYQTRGTGSEMAALSGMAELMVSANQRLAQAPTDADVRHSQQSIPHVGGSKLAAELQTVTGITPRRFHTARTEFRSHSLSPAVLYLVESGAVLRTHEDVPVYQKTSPTGIMRCVKIMATVRSMAMDRTLAKHSVGDSLGVAGVGWRGDPRLGRGSQDAQLDAFEGEIERGFNSRFASGCGLSVDVTTRKKGSSALGLSWMQALEQQSGSGPSPERIPPYAFPTVFGSDLEYLPSTEPPRLTGSTMALGDLPNAAWLRYGNLHTAEVSGRPLYTTARGTQVEEAANPPYDVWSLNDRGLAPGADGHTNPSALAFEAELVRAGVFNPREFNRTMGSVPTVSCRRSEPYPVVVDSPAIKTVAGAHCLVKLCVPRSLRTAEAASAPVPVSFLVGFQGIFR
jgi:hypothetical protein